MPYSTLKNWLKDPEFVDRMNELREDWADSLRAVAVKRAAQKSDVLLIFLLKSLAPEHYDDEVRRAKYLAENNIANPDNAPVTVVLVRDEAPEGVEPPAVEGSQEH